MLQVRSGGPVNAITGADIALNGFTDNVPTQRPNVVPGQDFYGDKDSLTNYYNIAAFAQPAAGTLGDAPLQPAARAWLLAVGSGIHAGVQCRRRPADRAAGRSDQPDQ